MDYDKNDVVIIDGVSGRMDEYGVWKAVTVDEYHDIEETIEGWTAYDGGQ